MEEKVPVIAWKGHCGTQLLQMIESQPTFKEMGAGFARYVIPPELKEEDSKGVAENIIDSMNDSLRDFGWGNTKLCTFQTGLKDKTSGENINSEGGRLKFVKENYQIDDSEKEKARKKIMDELKKIQNGKNDHEDKDTSDDDVKKHMFNQMQNQTSSGFYHYFPYRSDPDWLKFGGLLNNQEFTQNCLGSKTLSGISVPQVRFLLC